MNEHILDDIVKAPDSLLRRLQRVGFIEFYMVSFGLLSLFFVIGVRILFSITNVSYDVSLLGLMALMFFIILCPVVYVLLWRLAAKKYEEDSSVNLFNKKRFLFLGIGTAFISIFYVGMGTSFVYKQTNVWMDGLNFDLFELIYGASMFLDGIFGFIYMKRTIKKWQTITAKHTAAEIINKYMLMSNNKK